MTALEMLMGIAMVSAEREARLRGFQRTHGNVPIIDPVEHVRPLYDRATMLGALSDGITILVGSTAEQSARAVLHENRICPGLLACLPAREDNRQAAAVGVKHEEGKRLGSNKLKIHVVNDQQAPHDVPETSAIGVSAPAQVVLQPGALLTQQHAGPLQHLCRSSLGECCQLAHARTQNTHSCASSTLP